MFINLYTSNLTQITLSTVQFVDGLCCLAYSKASSRSILSKRLVKSVSLATNIGVSNKRVLFDG